MGCLVCHLSKPPLCRSQVQLPRHPLRSGQEVHLDETDVLVITKPDRLARSTRHLCELADTYKTGRDAVRIRVQGAKLAAPERRQKPVG